MQLRFKVALTVLAWCGMGLGAAQVSVVPHQQPQSLIGGSKRIVTLHITNGSNQPVDFEARCSLVQTTSATASRLGETPWKRLRILSGQTILESARLDFPPVKVETRFLIRWLEGTNRVFGTTEVLVYPTNLLKELGALAGEEPLGAFDPENQLKPLLKNVGVDFVDLQEIGLDRFTGKLAILGPFAAEEQMRDGITERVEAAAKRGAAIVWIQPPPKPRDKLKPSFYSVLSGRGTVVIVQPSLVADLAENPQSQLNLIQFARMALHPEPLQLPQHEPEP